MPTKPSLPRLVGREARTCPGSDPRLFAPQLAPALQPTRRQLSPLDRGVHGAPRLALVAAVAEAATLSQRGDIGKGGGQAVSDVEETRAAQPRRVDDATP